MTAPHAPNEVFPLHNEEDLVRLRRTVRSFAVELGFSLLDQTKVVTAASELARNTLTYGGGGTARLERLHGPGQRVGLRMVFEDRGPGIPDLALALRDGYTTGSGLGLGLGGSKRLMSEFQVDTEVGRYTRVTVVKWA